MSWNNTVTCSYCYRSGHNRRGCPTRRARLNEALLKPEEQREYADLNIIQEYERRSKDSRTRKCTYCGKEGHNRRSCEPLKAHTEHVVRQEIAFRKAFVKHINELGLNVGSLVVPHDQSENQRGYVEDVPHLVTKIKWDLISICKARVSFDRFVVARPVHDLMSDRRSAFLNITAPDHWPTGKQWHGNDQRWQEHHYGLKVVSSVSDKAEPPEGWLTDTQLLKEFFKDREDWMWPSEENGRGRSDYYGCDWWDLEKDQELEKIA